MIDRTYDSLGQMTTTAFSVTGASSEDNDYTNHYAFDSLGRVTSILQDGTGVAAKFVDFTYDSLTEQIDSIRRFEGSNDSGTLVLTTDFDYDFMGRIAGIHHFFDTDEDRNWDIGETQLAGYAYTWDTRSRITQIDSVADGQIDFAYDQTGQLLSVTYADEGHPLYSSGESYSFDENGNRASEEYKTGRGNELRADSNYKYTFDKEGNLASRESKANGEYTEYVWDHRGRLTTVAVYTASTKTTLLSKAVYRYDVFNRRIAKQVDTDGNGSPNWSETFIHDGDHIAMVFDGDDALTHRYLHGPIIDMVLADEAIGDDLYWALGDHQGTVRDIAIFDDGEEETVVVQHVVVDTFGNVVDLQITTDAPIIRFIYTGREYDPETGLYYYRRRYYDAATGRFISPDPLGSSNGDANTYRYVHNSAPNAIDPYGMDIIWIHHNRDIGHAAVLIGNSRCGYYYYSFEPLKRSVEDPKTKKVVRIQVLDENKRWVGKLVDGVHFDTLADAQAKLIDPNRGNKPVYDYYIRWKTTEEQDSKAKDFIKDYSLRYDVIYNSCVHMVLKAVRAAGEPVKDSDLGALSPAKNYDRNEYLGYDSGMFDAIKEDESD